MAKEKVSKYSNIIRKVFETKDFLIKFDYRGFYNKTLSDLEICYKDLRIKLGDLNSTNYELGLYHYNNGNISDARFRLWLYTKFWQGKPEVEYFLGRASFEAEKIQSAVCHLEKYLSSGNKKYLEECKYTLQLAKDNYNPPTDIPASIIKHKYNCRANPDQQYLQENIETSPQKKLCSGIEIYLNEAARPYGSKLLDIGCGTGIAGTLLREAKCIGFATGIDISNKMCEISATQRVDDNPVYNQVLNISLDDYLAQSSGAEYELIVLSGFLESYSNSKAIFERLTSHSADNSILAVMFKSSDETPYKFIPLAEEYLHNPDKIKTELENLGWDIAKESEVMYSGDIRGKYYICKKS